jgi:hypothetical protein
LKFETRTRTTTNNEINKNIKIKERRGGGEEQNRKKE